MAQSGGVPADQREAVVRLAAAYPANPQDAALDHEASAAASALQARPDNPINTCAIFQPWIEKKKYKYNHELTVAYVLGVGAYAAQHSEVTPSRRYYPALIAGSQSAIRAYQSILEHDPKATLDGMTGWSDQMRAGTFPYILMKKCSPPAVALSRPKGPVTTEEKQHIIALAGEMQKDPLDLSLRPEYQEMFVVVIQASDLTVNICAASSPWMDDSPEYAYGPDLLAVNLLSMASYVLQNPDTGKSGFVHGQAGLTASMRGYEAILRQHPNVRSKAMDAALDAEKQGTLDDWYKKRYAAKCRNQ